MNSKRNGLNAFDKIAKNANNVKEGKGFIKLTSELGKIVEEITSLKEQIAGLEAILETKSSLLIEHVQVKQEEDARNNDFHKSYTIEGNNNKTLLYSSINKFSVPQDEVLIAKVKDLLKERFDQWFNKKREIKLKDSVINDTEKINKLIEALDKAKLNVADYFNVTDKFVVVPEVDLDKEKYQLSKEQLSQFRVLVPQTKPSLK